MLSTNGIRSAGGRPEKKLQVLTTNRVKPRGIDEEIGPRKPPVKINGKILQASGIEYADKWGKPVSLPEPAPVKPAAAPAVKKAGRPKKPSR